MVASEDQTAVSHVAAEANDGDASAGSARHVQDGVGVLGERPKEFQDGSWVSGD
jgi:hypothetical protein